MGNLNEAIATHDFHAALEEANSLVESSRSTGGSADAEPLSVHLNSRGWINVQLGQYSAAVADATEARSLDPNLDQHNLKLARLFERHHQGVFEPEIEKLRKRFSAEPCQNIAMAYYSEGFYANAASYLNLAINVANRSKLPELYNALSGAYLGLDLFIDAYQASSKALALNSKIDPTNNQIALGEFKRIGQAPDPFSIDSSRAKAGAKKRAASDATGDAPPAGLDAKAEIMELNAAIAAEKAKSAENANSSSADLVGLLNRRARLNLNLRQFGAAIEDFLEIRRLDLTAGHDGLRLAQFFASSFDALLKPLFDQLASEKSAETYNQIGVIFFNNRFFDNAVTYFELSAALSEGLVRAESLNNLAAAYLNAQLTIEALRASAQAVALNPKISRTNYNMASSPLKLMRLDLSKLEKDRFDTL